MENLSIEKIEENYLYNIMVCVIYGVIFTFCLYKNLSGITYPIYTLAIITIPVFLFKKAGIVVKKSYLNYAAGIFLLGVSTFMTESSFFHFFNGLGIILLFMTSLIQQLNQNKSWSFLDYLKNILVLCGKAVISLITPVTHGIKYNKNKNEKIKSKTLKPIFIGIVTALLFLLCVIPLLVYSDQIFAQYFGKILNIFKFSTEIGILFNIAFGTIFMYSFFVALAGMNIKGSNEQNKGSVDSVTGITFLGILSIIYVFYCIIQILFLFLKINSGLPNGLTYSEYAHSGFWQLLGVSFINLLTVIICEKIFVEHRILKILLLIISVCTNIMALSAAYRMILYVMAYHLTFLRILVLWFLCVLMLIMIGVIISIFKKKFNLFKFAMVVVSTSYIIFSFSKVDRIIAEYNIAHWENLTQENVMYLLYSTSMDAAPAIEKIETEDIKWDEMNIKTEIDFYFSNIKQMNNEGRKWNYSIWSAQKAAEKYFN
jgi:hypothetical protein